MKRFYSILLLLALGWYHAPRAVAQTDTIPQEVLLSKRGVRPTQQPGHTLPLNSLQAGQEYEVFKAPPCLEGTYWVGFQLFYDLGDQHTTTDWTAELEVSLLRGEEVLWTKPLSVNSIDQIFYATVFHDEPLTCGEGYYLAVQRKDVAQEAPTPHLFLKFLLFPAEQPPFTGGNIYLVSGRLDRSALFIVGGSPQQAIAYDIEWVHYRDDESGSDNPDNIQNFVNKEPVRITTAATFYELPLFYPKGRLFGRIRAIGVNPAFPEHRQYGPWKYAEEMIRVDNQQPNKNWQAQTVFAEEGKYKRVVSYRDGTQRSRQTLTNLSTDYRTLVGETRYDYEGRPSLNVMPVPVAGDDDLRYRSNFNRFTTQDNSVGARTSALRHKFHYDNTVLDNSILSEASGAGKYYSPGNDLSSLHQDYIPHAYGYAYSQTQYTNDPTGRISLQSGVGEVFRTDGERATRYFYGSAASEELVRLFGSNVGEASHYRKKAVVDPNGQVSVSYLDQEERVVATALAGEKPENLAALASYEALDPKPVTVNLSTKNQANDGTSTQTHTILNVSPKTAYTFRYRLSALASQVATFGCQECAYDLVITLTDPNGRAVDLSGVAGNEATDQSFAKRNITATSCSSPTAEDITFADTLALVGDYTLEKRLVPQELTFERAKSVVSARESTQTKVTALQNSYTVEEGDCEVCRETCPEAETVIDQTINEVSARECDGILQQIEAELEEGEQASAHPRYCEYQLCVRNQASTTFERQIARVSGWSAALDQGYDELASQDPFFVTEGLSGEGQLAAMQGRLQNIPVATIEGKPYGGALADITNPSYAPMLVNSEGEQDPDGLHILYHDLMKQRRQGAISQSAYEEQLNQQRWHLFRSMYLEEKRKLTMTLAGFTTCEAALEKLGGVDELPTEEQAIRQWGEEQGLYDSVSTVTLDYHIANLASSCDTEFSEDERTALAGHLKAYFDKHPRNFFFLILLPDLLGGEPNLSAVNDILGEHSCSLDAVAVADPLECAEERTITLTGSVAAASAPTTPAAAPASDNTKLAPGEEAGKNQVTTPLSSPSPVAGTPVAGTPVAGTPVAGNPVAAVPRRDTPAKAMDTPASPAVTRSTSQEEEHLRQWEQQQEQEMEKIMRLEEERILQEIREARGRKQRRAKPAPAKKIGYQEAPDAYYPLQASGRTDYFYPASIADEVCNNDIDDDGDGLVDCEDGDCVFECQVEICDNGRDDNFNGKIDCADEECDCSTAPACPGDRDALLALYNSTDGANWTNPWDLTQPMSEWYGVTLNDEGCVVELDLKTNNLNGSLPSELGQLANLEVLNLYGNKLNGTIPPTIGSMLHLRVLYLFSNQLSGEIPSEIGSLSNLEALRLGLNSLTGHIPESIGALTKLQMLFLSNNHFDGALPSALGSLHELSILDFHNTNISGTIPPSLGNLLKVTVLDLSYNNLSGNVPEELGNLEQIEILELYSNKLNGPIPKTLSNLSNLKYLSLNNNLFTGSIPEELGMLPGLKSLYLSHNKLQGNIPVTFSNLSALRTLNLSSNQLSGVIPDVFTGLPNLFSLYLYENQFVGALPESLGNTSLNQLWLHDNELSGTLPLGLTKVQNQIIVRSNNYTFSNLLPIKQAAYQGDYRYAPQKRIDSLRIITGTTGIPLALSTTIDRSTDPPSQYQWFKYVDGTSDTPLQPSPTTEGHTFTLDVLTASDTGRYYYQVTNEAMPDLILTSHYITVQLEGGSRAQDSLALIAFYESIENKAEWPTAWDTTQSMDTWDGVTVSNGRVTEVDLSGQGLEGKIASELADLTAAENINLSNNRLRGRLPKGWNQLPGTATIDVSNNDFTFPDLEPLVTGEGAFPGTLLYAPQGLVGEPSAILVAEGDPFTLPYHSEATGNQYQWQKQVGGEWVDLDGATAASINVPSAVPDDAGQYRVKITNPNLPDLTLYTHPINVSVGAGQFTLCQAYQPPGQNPTLAAFSFEVDWDERFEQCMSNARSENEFLIQAATARLLEQEASSFYQSYRTNCLAKASEKLEYTYAPKEYHYTLYYYDQSGLLVQTVPPEGVKPLSTAQVSSFLSGSKTEPGHELKTTYRYNSLNQLIEQQTPDAGQSQFYYDQKGQLRLSQNAQQALDKHYSYTQYDEQGRTIEVGELTTTEAVTSLESKLEVPLFPQESSYTLSDITRTYYDSVDSEVQDFFAQSYVRNRVSWTAVEDQQQDLLTTHYSYDAHGNVKSLLQYIPDLGYKRTDYIYDLVSGNVRFVLYEFDSADQFVQEYRYDADNRLTEVLTSSDRFTWHKEAHYFYYAHGPLARIELGEHRVQGLDYYYTLQGWLKGVNGTTSSNDPGGDGLGTSPVGKDAFSFALGYHEGDYQGIGATPTTHQLWDRLQEQQGHTGLYNGNISWMQTSLPGLKQQGLQSEQAMLYEYDQLNRLVQAQSLRNFSEESGFAARDNSPKAFDAAYSYDANGNLLTLERRDQQAALMDAFAYQYQTATNRLSQVSDTGTEPDNSRFAYDKIGNLTQDSGEGTSIDWTPYGKPRTVTKTDGTIVNYRYDAAGNRVEKQVVSSDTSYVTRYIRDASGNVLAIYENDSLTEQPIYGSSRLGVYRGGSEAGEGQYGNRRFELSNHLGNVQVVVSDKILMEDSDGDGVAESRADVLASYSYYPYGMMMPGRVYNPSENRYKYQGSESDDEISGVGNTYHTYYRTLDVRSPRWWSVDPKVRPWESPYVAMGSNPILYNDPMGDTTSYYDIQTGNLLGTINNAGELTRIKIDQGHYNAFKNFRYNNLDLDNQGNANMFVNTLNLAALSAESVSGENRIAFENSIRLTFTGTANANNPAEANGTLNVTSVFDDGSTLNLGSYQAIGGPYGNGSPENGGYTVSNLRRRNDNQGMIRDGFGFSLNLDPNFDTGRTLLRIHPDGNNAGTLGCIGLQCNENELRAFYNIMRSYLNVHRSAGTTINIDGNPDNDGRGASRRAIPDIVE